MKVTLDLDQLLSDGKIDQAEYEKLRLLAAKSTSSLAFNILIGFGVVAVSGAVLALVPAPATATASISTTRRQSLHPLQILEIRKGR